MEEAEVGSKPVFCESLPPIRSVWSMYDLVLVIYTKRNLYTFTLYSLLLRIGHLFPRPVMGGWCKMSRLLKHLFQTVDG